VEKVLAQILQMVAMEVVLKSMVEKVEDLVLRMTEEVMFSLLEDRPIPALAELFFYNQANHLAVLLATSNFLLLMLVSEELLELLQLQLAVHLLVIAAS